MHQYRYGHGSSVHLYDTRASRLHHLQQPVTDHLHPYQLDQQQRAAAAARVVMTMPPQRQMHHVHAPRSNVATVVNPLFIGWEEGQGRVFNPLTLTVAI